MVDGFVREGDYTPERELERHVPIDSEQEVFIVVRSRIPLQESESESETCPWIASNNCFTPLFVHAVLR